MQKLISYFQRVSSGKAVLLLLVVTNLIYALMLMYSLPLVSSYAPELVLFDMSPTGYSFVQATELLASLGTEGRNTYLFIQLPLDFIYPGMFAVSYGLLITWMLKQYLAKDSKLFFMAFVPLLAGGFDYLENIGIIAMLNSFPGISESLVSCASAFTLIKSGLTTVFFVMLLLVLIPILKRRLGLGQNQ